MSQKTLGGASGEAHTEHGASVVLEHLNEKKQIHMIKDVAMQCYTAVHYLSEQARLLNQHQI